MGPRGPRALPRLGGAEPGLRRPFRRGARLHAQTPDTFERARTELCYGERLRRARRGREAKPHLLSALGTFERLGAGPWAARARREEAAAALFVSPKTIEYHLAAAYRKLDVRSRTELAIAMGEGRVP